jgi:hypothetical protein
MKGTLRHLLKSVVTNTTDAAGCCCMLLLLLLLLQVSRPYGALLG